MSDEKHFNRTFLAIMAMLFGVSLVAAGLAVNGGAPVALLWTLPIAIPVFAWIPLLGIMAWAAPKEEPTYTPIKLCGAFVGKACGNEDCPCCQAFGDRD